MYKITKEFPKQEIYGLSSQIQRAAVSIPSNISEGHGRGSTKEYLHFVVIALGSLAELETQVMLAGRLEYLSKDTEAILLSMMDEEGKILRGLHRSLKAKLSSSPSS